MISLRSRIAVVEERSRKIPDPGRRSDRLVDQHRLEPGDESIEDPDRSFGRPVTVPDLAITDKGPTTDPPACQQIGRGPVDARDRRHRTVVENLVGIDGQNPVVAGQAHRAAFLRAVSVKGVLVPTRTVPQGDFPGPVGGSRVEDDDLGAHRQGPEASRRGEPRRSW